MTDSVKLEGVQETLGNINRKINLMKKYSVEGLTEAGLKLLSIAQGETPVDTGNLKGSIYHIIAGDGMSGSFGFGQGANYAYKVHEDLKARHRVGKAKYLRDPLKRNREKIIKIISESVSRAISS